MLSEFVDHEFHGRKKKKPRNFSGRDLSAKSRHVRSLFRSHLVPVCTRDFTGRVSGLIQITTACCYETGGRSVVQKEKKKKKKRQMRRFLKCGENSVRNLCPFKCEIQIAVKLHLYERNSNIRLVWTLSSRIFRNYYYGTDGMKLHVDGVPYILTYLSFHFKHLNRSNPHANVFLLHCIYVFDESNHILAEI